MDDIPHSFQTVPLDESCDSTTISSVQFVDEEDDSDIELRLPDHRTNGLVDVPEVAAEIEDDISSSRHTVSSIGSATAPRLKRQSGAHDRSQNLTLTLLPFLTSLIHALAPRYLGTHIISCKGFD